jgi:hypothetical protein
MDKVETFGPSIQLPGVKLSPIDAVLFPGRNLPRVAPQVNQPVGSGSRGFRRDPERRQHNGPLSGILGTLPLSLGADGSWLAGLRAGVPVHPGHCRADWNGEPVAVATRGTDHPLHPYCDSYPFGSVGPPEVGRDGIYGEFTAVPVGDLSGKGEPYCRGDPRSDGKVGLCSVKVPKGGTVLRAPETGGELAPSEIARMAAGARHSRALRISIEPAVLSKRLGYQADEGPADRGELERPAGPYSVNAGSPSSWG